MTHTLQLIGNIDSSMSLKVDEQIEQELSQLANKPTGLIFDCSDLNYISSSGLRILLKYKKLYKDVKIINLSNENYNIFEITGFTKIMEVSRAMRQIDLAKCELVGEGGNGAVYRINDEEIVKVSKHEKGEESLIREQEKIKEAFLLGMPTVISFDTVECSDGRKGIVMEALDSRSVGHYISEDPKRMDEIIPKYVDLFRQTNALETDSCLFHNIKERLRSYLTLPTRIINDEEAAMFESILDVIPDSKHLVHFDGHTGNVLMHGAKNERSLMLIDLGDTGYGHPVLEIAGMMFLMLEPDFNVGKTMSETVTGMSKALNHEFCRKVMAEMFHETDPEKLDHLYEQAALVGRVKSAFVGQKWGKLAPHEDIRIYVHQLVRQTVTLIPQIREAVKELVQRMDA